MLNLEVKRRELRPGVLMDKFTNYSDNPEYMDMFTGPATMKEIRSEFPVEYEEYMSDLYVKNPASRDTVEMRKFLEDLIENNPELYDAMMSRVFAAEEAGEF